MLVQHLVRLRARGATAAAATAAQLNEAVFTGNVERALFLLQGDLDVDAVKMAND